MSFKLLEDSSVQAEPTVKTKPLCKRILSGIKSVLFKLSLGQYHHKLYHECQSKHTSWVSVFFTVLFISLILSSSIITLRDVFKRSHLNVIEKTQVLGESDALMA